MNHPQLLGGGPRSNLAPPEFFPQGIKGVGDWHFLPAKPYAPRFRRRDALRLPLADIFTLHLGHIVEDLQHQIRDEGARQILRLLPGVQQVVYNCALFLNRVFRSRSVAPFPFGSQSAYSASFEPLRCGR